MWGNICVTAFVAGVVTITRGIGAIADLHIAAVIANVIIVADQVNMVSHIVFTATVITNVVEILIFMRERISTCKCCRIVRAYCTARAGFVINSRA